MWQIKPAISEIPTESQVLLQENGDDSMLRPLPSLPLPLPLLPSSPPPFLPSSFASSFTISSTHRQRKALFCFLNIPFTSSWQLSSPLPFPLEKLECREVEILVQDPTHTQWQRITNCTLWETACSIRNLKENLGDFKRFEKRRILFVDNVVQVKGGGCLFSICSNLNFQNLPA